MSNDNFPKSKRDADNVPFNSILSLATELRDGNLDPKSYGESEINEMLDDAVREFEKKFDFSPEDLDLIEALIDELYNEAAQYQ